MCDFMDYIGSIIFGIFFLKMSKNFVDIYTTYLPDGEVLVVVPRSGGVPGPGVDDAGHHEAEEGDQQHQRDPRHAEAGLHHRVDHRTLQHT